MTSPDPIAPPLDPAPPTDAEVADLVHCLGADALEAIGGGVSWGADYARHERTRTQLEDSLTMNTAVYRAAALAAYDEACGR